MKTDGQRGLTLIEILFVFLALSLGVTGVILGGKWFGIVGYVLGGPAAIGGLFAGMQILGLIENLFWGGIPRLPHCRSGKCRARDYEPVRIGTGEWVRMCRCGDRYAKRGRRFVEVDETGTAHPYLKWVPFVGWRIEK